MTLRLAMLSAAGLGTVALAACQPPHPHHHGRTPLKAITALTCPEHQGDLVRSTVATDGRSCGYTGPGGEAVALQLVDLAGGDAAAALKPIEARLMAEIPGAADRPATSPPTPPVPPVPGAAPSRHGDNDEVKIDLPGLHIHAHGDHADVNAAGARIRADDQGAVVDSGSGGKGVTVNAGGGGARVTVTDDKDGVHDIVMFVSDTPGPHGYRMAGYEARGPAAGPIAVASFMSRSKDEDEDGFRHDL
ncbi:MAG: hypothetical protein JOZ27_07415, partial [Caulobacteraceae bacterium]|nr:hypothetical protein [Caulobacteraceae bacterium]